MDVRIAHMVLENNLYIIKTGNDLTFHYHTGESVDVIDCGLEKRIPVEELENKHYPIYILDPGSELAYMISYVTRLKK